MVLEDVKNKIGAGAEADPERPSLLSMCMDAIGKSAPYGEGDVARDQATGVISGVRKRTLHRVCKSVDEVRKQEGPLAGNRGGKRGFELQRQVLSKLFGNGGRSWPQKQPGRCAASWDLDDGFYVLKQDYVQQVVQGGSVQLSGQQYPPGIPDSRAPTSSRKTKIQTKKRPKLEVWNDLKRSSGASESYLVDDEEHAEPNLLAGTAFDAECSSGGTMLRRRSSGYSKNSMQQQPHGSSTAHDRLVREPQTHGLCYGPNSRGKEQHTGLIHGALTSHEVALFCSDHKEDDFGAADDFLISGHLDAWGGVDDANSSLLDAI